MNSQSNTLRRLLFIAIFGAPILFFDLVVFPVILQTGYTQDITKVNEWTYGIAAVVVVLMLVALFWRRKS